MFPILAGRLGLCVGIWETADNHDCKTFTCVMSGSSEGEGVLHHKISDWCRDRCAGHGNQDARNDAGRRREQSRGTNSKEWALQFRRKRKFSAKSTG